MATVSRLLEAAEHVQAALLLGRLPGGLPAMVTTPSISVYPNRYSAVLWVFQKAHPLTWFTPHPHPKTLGQAEPRRTIWWDAGW